MPKQKKKRIALFSYEKVFDSKNRVSGPAQRLWETAKVLKKEGLDITIFENQGQNTEKDGIKFLKWLDQPIKPISFDCAIVPLSHFAYNFTSAIRNVPLVIDLTTPITIETLYFSKQARKEFSFAEEGLFPTIDALIRGDKFFCATERQYYFYIGMLSLLGKINPESKDENILEIAPMGISSEEPKKHSPIMKGKLFKKESKVILFPSSLFPWINPKKALNIFLQVLEKIPDAKMVFWGSINPKVSELCEKGYKEIKDISDEKGLTGKSIFFTEWTGYEERSDYYLESDLAIVTYNPKSIETKLAYRTRVLDCIWGNLPIIVSKGDKLSEDIEKYEIGKTTKDNNKETAEEIIKIFKENRTEKYRDNLKKIKQRFYWENNLKNIAEFCKNPKKGHSKINKEKQNIAKNTSSEIQPTFYLASELINKYKKDYTFILNQVRSTTEAHENENYAREKLEKENRELLKKIAEENKNNEREKLEKENHELLKKIADKTEKENLLETEKLKKEINSLNKKIEEYEKSKFFKLRKIYLKTIRKR